MLPNKLLFVIAIILTYFNAVAQNERVTSEDLKEIPGIWYGKLIYLDYQTNKPYEMPVNLEIIEIETNRFKFVNTYPNESSANSADTFSLNDNGKKINDENVISKKKLTNGDLEIITEKTGKDGNENKQATIRYFYLINKNKFEIKKEVQYSGTTNWILRHTYKYTKTTENISH